MLYNHKISPAAEYKWPLTECRTASAIHLSAGMLKKFQVLVEMYHQTALTD